MFTYIILFVLIEISNSLQCYACESCNDPFNIYNAPILYLLDNEGFNCTKEHTMFGINRGATKLCNLNNTDQWCCQIDLCNSSTKLSLMNFIYLIIVIKGYISEF